MLKWLAIVGVVAALVEGVAAAQMKGLSPGEVAGVARTRALDLRITQVPDATPPQPLVRGMIVSQQLSPNAVVGIGLANIYGRKKAGNDMRISGGGGRSRKPAVTFTMRF